MRINHEALRVIRERSGYTVSSLAQSAGVERSHLSNIEAGRRQGSPAVIVRLANTLQVPVTALLAVEVEPAEVA